jgi:hypothetical protein
VYSSLYIYVPILFFSCYPSIKPQTNHINDLHTILFHGFHKGCLGLSKIILSLKQILSCWLVHWVRYSRHGQARLPWPLLWSPLFADKYLQLWQYGVPLKPGHRGKKEHFSDMKFIKNFIQFDYSMSSKLFSSFAIHRFMHFAKLFRKIISYWHYPCVQSLRTSVLQLFLCMVNSWTNMFFCLEMK